MKRYLMLLLFIVVATAVTGQESFSDGFGEGFGEGFGVGQMEDVAASSLQWNGRLQFDTRTYVDYDDPQESEVVPRALLDLELAWSADHSEVFVRTRIDDTDSEPRIDEGYLRLYYDSFDLQAGLVKTVWGSGDHAHVVDLLNSNDFSDFINVDYLERRLAVPMVKIAIPFDRPGAGSSGLVEVAVVPVLEPDLLPETGRWAPAEISSLSSILEAYSASLVVEETGTLDHTQAGIRVFTQVGPLDLAATAYRGFLKTPSAAVDNPLIPTMIELSYERLWAFGLDLAAVLGPFNTRAEAAYYMTDDIDGDDPDVPNNSLEYLAGFDVDLPLSNLNVNIQAVGSYMMDADSVDTLPNPIANYQYDADGIYTNTMLSLALTDRLRNDRILPTASVAMGLERRDLRISGEVEFVLRDDARLILEGVVYDGDDAGPFGGFRDNDFVQAVFEYSF